MFVSLYVIVIPNEFGCADQNFKISTFGRDLTLKYVE